jgi:hypothetical protein
MLAVGSNAPEDAARAAQAAARFFEGAPPEHRERLAERLAHPAPIQPL